MPVWAQYAQIQANLADVTGSFGSDAYLHFDLKNCGANVPWVTGNNLAIAKTAYDFRPDPTTGVINGQVIGTDQISCGNVNSSFYDVSVMKSNGQSIAPGPIPYLISSNTTWTPGAQPMANPPAAPGFVHIFGNPTATQQISQPAAGSGAVITVTVTSGAVSNCTVVSGGTGYFSPPALSLINAGSTTPAQIYASVSNGAVSSCRVVSSGSGYTGTPTVSIFGGTSLELFGVIDFSAANVIFPPGQGGGGFNCGSPTNPGIPYFNGQVCIVDTNATLDGNGAMKVAKLGVGVSPSFKLQVEAATAGDAVAKFKNTDPTGFGVKFIPGNDSNYGIAVQNHAEDTTEFSADGLGNATAATSMTAPTVTAGAVNTTGPGYTQVFQSQTAPDATFRANFMAAGQMVWYGNSATNKWDCINKDGSSCTPGGVAWSGTTSGTNANAGTFSATGNTWDFTGVTQFRLRTGAGLTTSATGGIGYDLTNNNWHAFQNGADSFLFSGSAAGTYVVNDCTKIASVNPLTFADSGGACGASGSASPIMFGSGVGISNSVTDYIGIGFLSTTVDGTQVPMPRSGTISNLQCRIGGTGLSASQTITITVRKGAASVGSISLADTTVTCTLNSTNTQGCSDGTHNFAVVGGDVLNIKTFPLNTPAVGAVQCAVQLL